jgi:hypothetical protein
MGHKIAKLLLEHAGTFLERGKAIETALSLGMPLHEIEEYLDWLDVTRGPPRNDTEQRGGEGPQGPPTEAPSKD